MEWKQSPEKYAENIAAVEKRLLPAVLAATPNNGQLIASWLIKNCAEAEGQVIDASVENIIRGIKALDAAGLIDWQTPPKVAPVKKRPDFLQTNDGARQNQPKNVELDIAMSQERKRREALGDAANSKIMADAAKLVRDHSNYPHSRAIRERTELKKLFDQLVSNKTHPQQVLEALQAKRATFEGTDITRPKIAGI